MAGKRDGGRDGVEALAALTDEILDPIAGADLDEMERRLKLATASVKLRQALVETLTREAELDPEDETLDAAGEERLREELYRRLAEDERGLFVRGRIMDWSPEGRFAQALARAGAMDGLSIGFRAEKARRDGRLRVLSGVDLWEVSLVTFPMLPGARFAVSRAPCSARDARPCSRSS